MVKEAMTNEQHNHYISWAFIAHGAFQMLMALLMLAILLMFFFLPDNPDPGGGPPLVFMSIIFGFVFIFQVAFALPSFIAAYGLRNKKNWARMASIVASVLAAMNVPIGTAACVYALWFFLGDNWKEIYPETAFRKDEKGKTPQFPEDRETRWTGYHTNEKGEVTFKPVDPPDWR